MTRTPTLRRALAAACALTLLLAACGDDDDSSDGDSTEETTESTAAESTESTEAEEPTESEPEEETTASEPEGDEEGGTTSGDPEAVATAEAVNLKLEDFADGWTEEPPTDDADPDPIDECFTTVDFEGTKLGEATSNEFSVEAGGANGDQGQAVSMETAVFDSPESATAVVEEVGTDAFAGCVNEYLSTQVLEGVEVQLAPVVDDPPVGEQSAGVAGAISVDPGDGSAPSQGLIDVHVIRTGSIVSFTLTLDTLGDQTFEQTLAELYTVIAERQAAEAG